MSHEHENGEGGVTSVQAVLQVLPALGLYSKRIEAMPEFASAPVPLRVTVPVSGVPGLVIAAAPYAEASRGASAASHVEDAGTSLHYAHDAGDCLLCAAQQLVGTIVSSSLALGELPVRAADPLSFAVDPHAAASIDTTRSRAPPFV